jgi:adenosine deaminase
MYKTIEDHPIKKLINLGFNISLNTDNRLMSNTSVKKEITIAKKLGINNVEELLNNSASYSFLN